MVLQPPQARARSGSQSLDASCRILADNADNQNNPVAHSQLRIVKDH